MSPPCLMHSKEGHEAVFPQVLSPQELVVQDSVAFLSHTTVLHIADLGTFYPMSALTAYGKYIFTLS